MKAILITTWELSEINVSNHSISASLMLLADRPFIQHVIEFTANLGIKDFEVVICQSPEKTRNLLRDGKRWGVNIQYHLARDPEKPYEILRRISSEPENGPVLLIHTDRLVLEEISPPETDTSSCLLYFRNSDAEDNSSQWTGWAFVSSDCGKKLPKDADEKALLDYLLACPGTLKKNISDSRFLSFRSHKDILESHKDVISKKVQGIMINGNEVEDNIWISRNVSLHPSAKIQAPVYIGENCSIERDVVLGPFAVTGNNCIISRGSIIENTVIFPGSYVGEALELRDVLVNRNRLVNVRLGAEITITEEIILGSMDKKNALRWWEKLLPRTIAFNLILLLLPVYMIILLFLRLFGKGDIVYRKNVVKLPAEPDSILWRTFPMLSFSEPDRVFKPGIKDVCMRFLPGLINIAQGNLHFIGVTPRTPEQIQKLPQEWKLLYLKSKPGLITEALVNFGTLPDEDELFSAETFYSVSRGFKYDFKLLFKYLGQITGFVPLPESSGNE